MKRMVILSGGQDSVTCLYWALAQGSDIVCLTFDYGQRHRVELECAAKIAKMAGVKQEVIELGALFGGSSPLTCLLYTSPSPRDQRGSRMPSSA